MATYLPDSNDYIAKTEAYTPDFKFLADVLGRRQDRYNTNYKHLNQLYGKVVHADLSHKDNIYKRDEYANLLVPKIQQLTGTDFSLQQNVDAAKALFKPFFEDETIVRDIVFTKRFNRESQRAENLRKSADAKERDKYWQDGVDRLNYYMQDFKAASLQETMNIGLPEYVEDPDLIERGLEYLMNYEGKGKKLEITDVVFSPDKKWMTTMTNGTVLTNRPTGVVDEETGQMGTYNPAANILAKTILDDPLIARGYATSAYVKARKFYENEDNITKYGSKENAEKYFLNQMINQAKDNLTKTVEKESEQKDKLTQQKNSWEKYLELYPNASKKAIQTYMETLSAISTIEKGIEKDNTTIADISREYKDLAEMRNIAYQAYMNSSINNDILRTANEYAMTTMEVKDRKLNPVWEKQLDFKYKKALEKIKLDNAKELEDYKKSLEPQGLALDGSGMESGVPDASINLSTYEQRGDLIGDNNEIIRQKTKNGVSIPMFTAVERMTTDLASYWSGAGYEINPTGLEVEVFMYDDGSGYMEDTNPTNKPGKWQKKFMTWAEAKKYLIDGAGRHQDDLENHYNEMMQKYHHQIELGDEGAFAPMLGTDIFNNLNTTISQIESQIRNSKADILNVVDKANETYKTAFDMIMSQADPSLKTFFEKYGSPIVEDEDGTFRMLTVDEYQSGAAGNWSEKVNEIGLPAELKGIEEFGSYDKWREYINSIFTPEVLEQLGEDNYTSAIKNLYLFDMSSIRSNIPRGSTQEGWDKSVNHVQNSMTDIFTSSGRTTDGTGRKFPIKLQHNVGTGTTTDNVKGPFGIFDISRPNKDINSETKTAYMNVYDAMNERMTSSVAGSGFPTFSARNEFMLKDQIDDGGIVMTDDWNGKYIHGASPEDVAQQLTIALNATSKLDKSQVIVKYGIPQDHSEKGILTDTEWSEGMDQFLNQIRTDLREAPSATNKPNINVTYNENLNGMSGWTLQFDQDYISKLRSNNSVSNKILESIMDNDKNSITIYIEKGLINNPLDVINMNVSSTRRIIRENDEYRHVVPQGGNVRAWVGGDGQTIYTQMTEGTWIQDKDKEWVYRETPGPVVALPANEAKIDEMMRTQREHLEKLADKNRITHSKNIK